jgi:hypothetical protein
MVSATPTSWIFILLVVVFVSMTALALVNPLLREPLRLPLHPAPPPRRRRPFDQDHAGRARSGGSGGSCC